jgi:hypothetical protein
MGNQRESDTVVCTTPNTSVAFLRDATCSGPVVDVGKIADTIIVTGDGDFIPAHKDEPKREKGPRMLPIIFSPIDKDQGYSGKLAPAGRNDPCPCGSGKKYKKCHLLTAKRKW